jgi:hypothetical protein
MSEDFLATTRAAVHAFATVASANGPLLVQMGMTSDAGLFEVGAPPADPVLEAFTVKAPLHALTGAQASWWLQQWSNSIQEYEDEEEPLTHGFHVHPHVPGLNGVFNADPYCARFGTVDAKCSQCSNGFRPAGSQIEQYWMCIACSALTCTACHAPTCATCGSGDVVQDAVSTGGRMCDLCHTGLQAGDAYAEVPFTNESADVCLLCARTDQGVALITSKAMVPVTHQDRVTINRATGMGPLAAWVPVAAAPCSYFYGPDTGAGNRRLLVWARTDGAPGKPCTLLTVTYDGCYWFPFLVRKPLQEVIDDLAATVAPPPNAENDARESWALLPNTDDGVAHVITPEDLVASNTCLVYLRRISQ